jgi:hypothetical protein
VALSGIDWGSCRLFGKIFCFDILALRSGSRNVGWWKQRSLSLYCQRRMQVS